MIKWIIIIGIVSVVVPCVWFIRIVLRKPYKRVDERIRERDETVAFKITINPDHENMK